MKDNPSRHVIYHVISHTIRRYFNSSSNFFKTSLSSAMGACLSCLGRDDTDANERMSLLGQPNLYSDEDLQEEAWKQQQRQNELNNIVNDLNDHLIDVSTFLSNSSNGALNTISYMGSLYLLPRLNDGDEPEASEPTSPTVGPAGLDVVERQYPHLLTIDEKMAILKAVNNLSPEDQKYEVVQPSGPLYVVF